MNRTCRVCGKVFQCKGHLKTSCMKYLPLKACACASCCLDVETDRRHSDEPSLKKFKHFYAECFYITEELVSEWLFRRMVR